MTRKTYIIDGYNLIHKSPDLRKLFIENPQLARENLVSILSDFFSKRKDECIVVFDGNLNLPSSLSTPKVRVIFSKPPDKADDEIKKIIMSANLKDRLKFIVVSSDNEIINCAKACGSGRISSEEFWKILNSDKIKNKTQNDEKPFVKLTQEEIKKMFRE
ncbi:MAG: NYN domain-containing protein [Candidatus Kryptonium sp.]|nr:NYN domain-containing protein [Candidatus Kryptonium sp.]MCX7761421.1 NYN domain-containing protein [Candidatus Kryptonium sp.]MDW8109290.1 NYN domain-containing protein [Candidatus Kryptonium sp.]